MLFRDGEFTSHSGLRLPFKIDCDALTDSDLDTLAAETARQLIRFREAIGIPRGGMRFAAALRPYCTGSALDPVLIVDDVLTTGRSMQTARKSLGVGASGAIGVVIFARSVPLSWITPLFIEGGQ